MTVLDAERSAALKTQGQQIALDFAGDWPERALLELRGWIAVQKAMGLRTVTVEQFRAQARNHPTSSKGWGALPRIACKAGLIASTGQYVKAAAVKTRSHPVALWRVL